MALVVVLFLLYRQEHGDPSSRLISHISKLVDDALTCTTGPLLAVCGKFKCILVLPKTGQAAIH